VAQIDCCGVVFLERDPLFAARARSKPIASLDLFPATLGCRRGLWACSPNRLSVGDSQIANQPAEHHACATKRQIRLWLLRWLVSVNS